MCVCVCVFIKLHITAQSGPVILFSHSMPLALILPRGDQCVCVCMHNLDALQNGPCTFFSRSPPYYLVVVGDRTNGKWFDHVLTLSPDEYGPAAICVAPSTARFEVIEHETPLVVVYRRLSRNEFCVATLSTREGGGEGTVSVFSESCNKMHPPVGDE